MTARGVSHGVGSPEVFTFSLHVSSSVQNAMRPMFGFTLVGLSGLPSGWPDQSAASVLAVAAFGTVSVPSCST